MDNPYFFPHAFHKRTEKKKEALLPNQRNLLRAECRASKPAEESVPFEGSTAETTRAAERSSHCCDGDHGGVDERSKRDGGREIDDAVNER